jgi:hypothetical protein
MVAKSTWALMLVALSLSSSLRAEESEQGRWIPISTSTTDELTKSGKKIGYPGLTAGVATDRTNGDIYMVVCDLGIFKSTDQGKSFARADGGAIGGRCETGFALNVDPAGKRMAAFMIYGKAGSLTADSQWHQWKTNHLDFGAVDWEATGQALLAIRHESGGVLALSTDNGATWTDLGKGFKNVVGLFDAKTLIASKSKGLERSTDGGQTWTAVSDITPTGAVMSVYKGVGYFTTDRGLLVTKDQGQTWNIQGKEVKALAGPYFGKDEKQIVVATKDGLMETTDAGTMWKVAAPLPPDFKHSLVGPNYGWDPERNILYGSTMGKPTYRYQR